MDQTGKKGKTSIIVLSVALFAVLIAGLFLYRDYLHVKAVLHASEKKALEYEKSLSDLNEKVLPAREDAIAGLTERLKDAQSRVEELEKNEALSEDEKGRLQTQYDNLVSDLSELDKARERISELDKVLAMKNQRLSLSEESLRKLETDLGEEKRNRQQEVAELQERITELQEQNQNLDQGKALAETEKSQLQTKYDALLYDLKEKITGLQEQNRNLDQGKALAETERSQLQTKYDALLYDLKDFEKTKEHLSEMENALDRKDRTIAQLEDEVHGLEVSLEKDKREGNALIAQLRKESEDLRAQISLMNEKTAEDKVRIESLQKELDEIKGYRVAAENQVGELRSTFETLISDLNRQIKNQEVTIQGFKEKISITFVDRILFDLGKADITEEGKAILDKVGRTLKKVQDRNIRVVGHTDNIPISQGYLYKFPSNWELSASRAAAVVRYFQDQMGFDPANMEAVGQSFYRPIASNETAEGRAQNRRVNIVIAPKLN